MIGITVTHTTRRRAQAARTLAGACVFAALTVVMVGPTVPAWGITTADAGAEDEQRQARRGWTMGRGAQADADALAGGGMFRIDPLATAIVTADDRQRRPESSWRQQLRDWVRLQVATRGQGTPTDAEATAEAVLRAVAAADGESAGAHSVGATLGDLPEMFALQFDDRTGELRGFSAVKTPDTTTGRIDRALSETRGTVTDPDAPPTDPLTLLAAASLKATPSADPLEQDRMEQGSFLARTYRLGMKRSTQVAAVTVLLVGYLALTWWVRHRLNRKDRSTPSRRHRRRTRTARAKPAA